MYPPPITVKLGGVTVTLDLVRRPERIGWPTHVEFAPLHDTPLANWLMGLPLFSMEAVRRTVGRLVARIADEAQQDSRGRLDQAPFRARLLASAEPLVAHAATFDIPDARTRFDRFWENGNRPSGRLDWEMSELVRRLGNQLASNLGFACTVGPQPERSRLYPLPVEEYGLVKHDLAPGFGYGYPFFSIAAGIFLLQQLHCLGMIDDGEYETARAATVASGLEADITRADRVVAAYKGLHGALLYALSDQTQHPPRAVWDELRRDVTVVLTDWLTLGEEPLRSVRETEQRVHQAQDDGLIVEDTAGTILRLVRETPLPPVFGYML